MSFRLPRTEPPDDLAEEPAAAVCPKQAGRVSESKQAEKHEPNRHRFPSGPTQCHPPRRIRFLEEAATAEQRRAAQNAGTGHVPGMPDLVGPEGTATDVKGEAGGTPKRAPLRPNRSIGSRPLEPESAVSVAVAVIDDDDDDMRC
jgi:hypothetical protein